ncbi:hypothetical protein [Pseudonocardia acaciae]|uniref:phage tail tube protein n=1 Tax=Pseudonocardia acaciae TaxID=551276 RepID=UPI0007E8DFC7|nr:hypothetical protein [Pseudonocardia acaciae]
MALNATLARLGVTGMVMTAPTGTTTPTDLASWPTGWADCGYISDDGLEEEPDEDTEEFTPWQSSTPIRVEVTKSTKTFKFTCWESNWTTVSLYYRVEPEDVTVTGTAPNQIVSFNEEGKPRRQLRAFGFDVIDGNYHRRAICPLAEVTERGSVVYKSDELVAYEMTVTAYPGADGVSIKRLFKEGWTPPAP